MKSLSALTILLCLAANADARVYDVHVVTSNVKKAGTNANVSIELKGTKGASRFLPLSTRGHNDFKRGSTGRYRVQAGRDLGTIWGVTLKQDGKGAGSDWHVDHVVAGNKTFVFKQWLGTNKPVSRGTKPAPPKPRPAPKKTQPAPAKPEAYREFKVDTAKNEVTATITHPLRTQVANQEGQIIASAGGIHERKLALPALDIEEPVGIPEIAAVVGQGGTGKFDLSLQPLVKMYDPGSTTLILHDTSTFHTKGYSKSADNMGFFLDQIEIVVQGPGGPWEGPEFGPKTANKEAGYSSETSFGFDMSLGFEGKKLINGSAGLSWARSSGSDVVHGDVAFTAMKNGTAPVFTWKTSQMYASPTDPRVYQGNLGELFYRPRGVHRMARNKYQPCDPPAAVRTSFDTFAHSAWRALDPSQIRGSFKVQVTYSVTYRHVFRGKWGPFGKHPRKDEFGIRGPRSIKVTHIVPIMLEIPAPFLKL